MATELVTPRNRPIGTSAWVRDVLREAIFAGKLKPGDWLVEGKLAKELRVGISPLREALQELAHLGLVTPGPNRGTYVTQLTATEVQQIYRLRSELEALSVGYALESRNRAGVEELAECANRMMTAARANDSAQFLERDIEFHNLICRMAGDRFMEKCLLCLTTPLFAFVLIRLKQEPSLFDLVDFARSHQRIVELFTWTDAARAREEMSGIMHGFRETVLGKLYAKDLVVPPQ